jgi:hypothetical protein
MVGRRGRVTVGGTQPVGTDLTADRVYARPVTMSTKSLCTRRSPVISG